MKIRVLFYVFLSLSFLSCLKKSEPIYLNSSYSDNERLEDLISRMTIEEKVGQMCQLVGLNQLSNKIDSFDIKRILNDNSKAFYKGFTKKDIAKMVIDGKVGSFLHVLDFKEANYLQRLAMNSRLKIPLIIGIDAIHGNGMVSGSTIYPSPISISATFSDSLSCEIGKQTAMEMRATGSHWAFTPNIDVLRDPRWGRVGETFGEDPKLVSNMGYNMIKGLQLENNVIACAKHFIAGSEPVNGLNFSPMDLSERSMKEIFLPPFRKAVDAGVYSVMAAHNEINGVPCHMNKYLMNNILRKELNFKGFIVSDWMDVERIHSLHNVAEDFKQACLFSIDAGLDMNMHGPYFLEEVLKLINENKISESRIDKSIRKILLAKFKLGLFENPLIDVSKVKDRIFTEKHQKTSLEVARRSIVLLKNSNKILPLKNHNKIKILVTGPNANNHSLLGDWTKPQPMENVITVYQGIKMIGNNRGIHVDFYDSNSDILNISEKDISQTVKFAKDYDYVFVVVGDNSLRYLEENKTAGENVARSKLNLAGRQLELVKRLRELNRKIVVIYINGKPIAEPWISQNIDAIIEAWEPGLMGGKAIGEIIFGDINPSGKLPLTFPRSVGQLQMIYNHKPTQYYRKYIDEEITPLYYFGHGLSYAEFEYSNLNLDYIKGTDSHVKVSFLLNNKSDFDGEEVVQVYFRDCYSSVTRPVKELVEYKRVFVEAHQSKNISLNIDIEKLAFYDINMDLCVEKGDFVFMIGGSSDSNYQIRDSVFIDRRYQF